MVNPRYSSSDSERAFREYFHNLVDDVLDPLVSKAREYGTTELEQLGGVFRTTQGFAPSTAQANLQVACWFYAQGKAARWTAAVRRGETPSVDTVLDLMIYCMMYMKITETGEWWSDAEAPSVGLRTASGVTAPQTPSSGASEPREYYGEPEKGTSGFSEFSEHLEEAYQRAGLELNPNDDNDGLEAPK